jgi:CheY-specific phosphatase CheX
MKTIRQVLNDIIPAGTQTIFKNSGIDVDRMSGKAHYDMVAVIGFSGDGFGGSLGFAAEHSFVNKVFGESDTLLSDSWLGEIANLLLGRLKNSLLTYGVEYRLAIPMVLHGLQLRVRAEEGKLTQFQFKSEAGFACVWVDANWNIDKELTMVDAAQHSKAEGEIMLF